MSESLYTLKGMHALDRQSLPYATMLGLFSACDECSMYTLLHDGFSSVFVHFVSVFLEDGVQTSLLEDYRL